MIHVGKHWVETGDHPMLVVHVHVDTVGVHDVDGLQDVRHRPDVTKFQSGSQKLHTVLLMEIPHFGVVFLLMIQMSSKPSKQTPCLRIGLL